MYQISLVVGLLAGLVIWCFVSYREAITRQLARTQQLTAKRARFAKAQLPPVHDTIVARTSKRKFGRR